MVGAPIHPHVDNTLVFTRRLCLLSSSHSATSNSNDNIPMQEYYNGPRVARDALVLGSGGSFDQGTPTAPSLEDTTKTEQHFIAKNTLTIS